jgi:MFS family permease
VAATTDRATSTRRRVASYATVATCARSATEALGPALLLSALASGRGEHDGALVLAAFTGLAALSGPLVGALLDRTTHPGRVIRLATAVLALVVAVLSVTMPTAPIIVLVLIAAVGGFAHPALTGGMTAQLPTLVSGPVLDRVYGIDAATYNIGAILGPPLAAAAVVLGRTGPVVFTMVLLLVALAVLPLVHFPTRSERGARRSFVRDITTGFRGLVSTPHLAYASVLTTIGFAGQAAFLVTVPLIANAQTGSLAASGWVFGAAALGGVISTLAVARRPVRDTDQLLTFATLAIGVAFAVLAFSPIFAVTVAAAFAYGAVEGPLLTALFRIRTREAAPQVRSQVFTTGASLRTSVFAAATAVFGAMLGAGVTSLLVAGALLQVVAVAAAVGAATRIRHSAAHG